MSTTNKDLSILCLGSFDALKTRQYPEEPMKNMKAETDTTQNGFLKVYYPCIRLARGKFELTNQDSAGGKNSTVLKSRERHCNQPTFLTGEGIKYARKGIYNFKNHTSLKKVKNINHFVFPSFYFGAKSWSPAFGMATRSQQV